MARGNARDEEEREAIEHITLHTSSEPTPEEEDVAPRHQPSTTRITTTTSPASTATPRSPTRLRVVGPRGSTPGGRGGGSAGAPSSGSTSRTVHLLTSQAEEDAELGGAPKTTRTTAGSWLGGAASSSRAAGSRVGSTPGRATALSSRGPAASTSSAPAPGLRGTTSSSFNLPSRAPPPHSSAARPPGRSTAARRSPPTSTRPTPSRLGPSQHRSPSPPPVGSRARFTPHPPGVQPPPSGPSGGASSSSRVPGRARGVIHTEVGPSTTHTTLLTPAEASAWRLRHRQEALGGGVPGTKGKAPLGSASSSGVKFKVVRRTTTTTTVQTVEEEEDDEDEEGEKDEEEEEGHASTPPSDGKGGSGGGGRGGGGAGGGGAASLAEAAAVGSRDA